jgi:hypothetical protein
VKRLVIVAAIGATVAAGCAAGASEVVPAGKDSYMVAGKAVGGIMSGQSMIAATKEANQFCSKQGRFMIIRHTETAGNAGFGGEHSNLIFSCVTADDPEYQRPNLVDQPAKP